MVDRLGCYRLLNQKTHLSAYGLLGVNMDSYPDIPLISLSLSEKEVLTKSLTTSSSMTGYTVH